MTTLIIIMGALDELKEDIDIEKAERMQREYERSGMALFNLQQAAMSLKVAEQEKGHPFFGGGRGAARYIRNMFATFGSPKSYVPLAPPT